LNEPYDDESDSSGAEQQNTAASILPVPPDANAQSAKTKTLNIQTVPDNVMMGLHHHKQKQPR
jgi:hypothetical protein